MHVGFHLPRDNHIKLFAPLVELLLGKGCEVSILCDHRVKAKKMGIKAYQFPSVEKVPKFKYAPKICVFNSVGELAGIVKQNKIDVVFFVNFPPLSSQLKTLLAKENYFFITAEMQHYYDIMLLEKDISVVDVIYCYSKSWVESWKEYVAKHKQILGKSKENYFQEIDSKIRLVGFPVISQVGEYDRNSIREKYNMPLDKKVVLLMPFPKFSSVWIDSVYRPQSKFLKKAKLIFKGAKEYLPDVEKGIDDLAVTRGLREFCDKNNALLVTKGRIKNPVPKYVEKMSDRIFFDDCFHPYFTLELLAIADLSVSFCSMVVLESIAIGTPSICIMPHEDRIWQPYEVLGLPSEFKMGKGSIYNFPGVAYMKSAEHMSRRFGHETFEDYEIEPLCKSGYVEKFFGFNDFEACSRIYADLCQRLGHKNQS